MKDSSPGFSRGGSPTGRGWSCSVGRAGGGRTDAGSSPYLPWALVWAGWKLGRPSALRGAHPQRCPDGSPDTDTGMPTGTETHTGTQSLATLSGGSPALAPEASAQHTQEGPPSPGTVGGLRSPVWPRGRHPTSPGCPGPRSAPHCHCSPSPLLFSPKIMEPGDEGSQDPPSCSGSCIRRGPGRHHGQWGLVGWSGWGPSPRKPQCQQIGQQPTCEGSRLVRVGGRLGVAPVRGMRATPKGNGQPATEGSQDPGLAEPQ